MRAERVVTLWIDSARLWPRIVRYRSLIHQAVKCSVLLLVPSRSSRR